MSTRTEISQNWKKDFVQHFADLVLDEHAENSRFVFATKAPVRAIALAACAKTLQCNESAATALKEISQMRAEEKLASYIGTSNPDKRAAAAKLLVYLGSDDALNQAAKLRDLSFSNESFGDRDAKRLCKLTGLHDIDLSYTAITGDALKSLAALPELESLNLKNTDVLDYGLAFLGASTSLKILDLSGTNVSDSGLTHLAKMTQLEKVDLTDTAVTADGITLLHTCMPRCRIIQKQSETQE